MSESLNKTASNTTEAQKYSEGAIALAIEQRTAQIPSDVFLWAAIGSIGTSLALHISGKKDEARFVGQWVSPFLLLGVYNKLIKIAGSDRIDRS